MRVHRCVYDRAVSTQCTYQCVLVNVTRYGQTGHWLMSYVLVSELVCNIKHFTDLFLFFFSNAYRQCAVKLHRSLYWIRARKNPLKSQRGMEFCWFILPTDSIWYYTVLILFYVSKLTLQVSDNIPKVIGRCVADNIPNGFLDGPRVVGRAVC